MSWNKLLSLGISLFSLGVMPTAAQEFLSIDVVRLEQVGSVDERFQSFQIGMSHLTGGETWRTYDPAKDETARDSPTAFSEVREAREPADLAHPRLRALTAALAPLYIRYGGTTANSVYFQEDDGSRTTPPEGYLTVLTREAWKGAVEFAEAVDAKIVTSFAVSPGVRDEYGLWTPAQAEPWLRYTRDIGATIYAAELYNEPNAPEPDWNAEPKTAEEFARDYAHFRAFMAEVAPEIRLAGPGVIRLGIPVPIPSLEATSAEEYMASTPPSSFDIVSYHFYGAVSERCVAADSPAAISAEQALSESWLARPDKAFQQHRRLRDRYAPGTPLWLTETGAASCGGTRWQTTFLDTFRYLDTQARLARQGLDAIFTHALISGSNGIIDEHTFMPNASYWAALLWRRLMGTEVLAVDSAVSGVSLYAHCHPATNGAVTVMALNTTDRPMPITMTTPQQWYTLTAATLDSSEVQLNGTRLVLKDDDRLPDLVPDFSANEDRKLLPHSVNFIVVPEAGNSACVSLHD